MRKEKELVNLLRGLVDLLAEEACRNPSFSERLEQLLTILPSRRGAAGRASKKETSVQLPDLYAELSTLGEADFLLWLRSLPMTTLRSLIRANDFDPSRRTGKWKDTEKLATFIADSLRARMSRGSAFMGTG